MDDPQPTQKTLPQGKDEEGRPHKPAEIPIPTRDAFLRDLAKVAPPVESPSPKPESQSE